MGARQEVSMGKAHLGFAVLALSSWTAAAVAAAPAPPAPSPAPVADDPALQALSWRSVGFARGGRSVAVAGVPGQPLVYYFGGTGGGVWKTTDAGSTWRPITDGFLGTGSVGAIAVAPSDPNVVYVGMGESCLRGNVSHGDGVYRSTDAGKTWTHVGLRDTQQIGRVRVHPTDPDTAWVAALGHTFGPNPDRGIFRTKDGGKTWSKVLFVDDKTGFADLALDPNNPRVLYAASWQVRRLPWGFESGGPGSALYKSTDGGDTWKKVTGEGLPSKGVWGRIGVAVSPARPDRVWAMIEAEDGGLFRSDDAGRTWRKTNEDRRLRQRAWYYTHVYADTQSPDTVYVLNVGFFRSNDGGRTFAPIRAPHSDHHDLWIAPEDPRRMINANDGGANVSFDAGASWSRQDNQPTAQFYHVIADDRFPYWLYGAQQDNTTVAVSSRPLGGFGGVEWYPVGGCESGYIAPVPGEADVVYAGCYMGEITRYDHRTRQERDVSVWPEYTMGHGVEGMKYRFQWTFPIVASRHEPGVVYAAGNRVFRTTNGGHSWQPVSPDLTRNDASKFGPSGGPITKDNTSVEYYGTIFAFAESPRAKGVLWAGSDDGLVHLSRDGGATWSNVTPKGLPEWSMVSQIDPSSHDEGTAWVAINRYKHDDYRPFVYVTRDYGRSWYEVGAGLPSFVRAVREDPVRQELVFAGTETGVYYSTEGGRSGWRPLQMALPGRPVPEGKEAEGAPTRLPVVPITDLVVKGNDLAVSTQGRSFWVMDDISPLRHPSPRERRAQLLPPGGVRLVPPAPAVRFAPGAIFYYELDRAPKEGEEVTLEVLDGSGRVLRRLSNVPPKDEDPPSEDEEFFRPRAPRTIPARAGMNRFAWNLTGEPPKGTKNLILWGGLPAGAPLAPGAYTVRLSAFGKTDTQPLEVRRDPRVTSTEDDLRRQHDLLAQINAKLTAIHEALGRSRTAREQVTAAADRAKGLPQEKEIADAAEALKKKLAAVEERLYQTKNQSNQDPLNFPIQLNNKLSWLARVVGGAESAPTEQSLAVYEDLSRRIDVELAALNALLDADLRAFNELAAKAAVPAVKAR
jgi:photosystem II stability/assembly factor-like uncharacterized protein